jgi:hypothetical protein
MEIVKKALAWLLNKLPGGQILWAVLIIDFVSIQFGGIMATAVIAGLGAVLSFAFILAQMPEKNQKQVRTFVCKEIFGCPVRTWLDATLTIALTLYGFMAGGVTLALAAMFIGFNLSANFSYMQYRYDLDQKKAKLSTNLVYA